MSGSHWSGVLNPSPDLTLFSWRLKLMVWSRVTNLLSNTSKRLRVLQTRLPLLALQFQTMISYFIYSRPSLWVWSNLYLDSSFIRGYQHWGSLCLTSKWVTLHSRKAQGAVNSGDCPPCSEYCCQLRQQRWCQVFILQLQRQDDELQPQLLSLCSEQDETTSRWFFKSAGMSHLPDLL